MIVCSCNVITEEELRDCITGFLEQNPWQLVTPGKVYAAMAKKGRCCGCFPGVVDLIVETSIAFHREHESTEAQILDFVSRLKAERVKTDALRRAAARKTIRLRKISA